MQLPHCSARLRNAKQTLAAVLLVMVAVVGVTSCGNTRVVPSAKKIQKVKPRVVATAYPLYVAAQFIAAGRIDVSQGRQGGAFSTTPLTVEQLTNLDHADLIITPGRRTQPAFDDELSRRDPAVLDALETLGKRRAPDAPISDRDAYVWLDPTSFSTVINEMVKRMTVLDSAGEQIFEARAFEYRKKMATLDQEFAHTLGSCKRHTIVAEDRHFAPLAKRYGFELVVTDIENQIPGQIDHDGDSLETIGELRARGVEVTTVYAPSLPTSRKAAEILHRDQIRISTLDGLADLIPAAKKSGGDFDKTMKLNLDALTAGLDCSLAPLKNGVKNAPKK